MIAGTYSAARVVSEDIPCAVRYSSNDVRRNVLLTKNSNGTGFRSFKRLFTIVDNPCRRSPIDVRCVMYGTGNYLTSVDQDGAKVLRK